MIVVNNLIPSSVGDRLLVKVIECFDQQNTTYPTFQKLSLRKLYTLPFVRWPFVNRNCGRGKERLKEIYQ